jgi:hypothetical protein
VSQWVRECKMGESVCVNGACGTCGRYKRLKNSILRERIGQGNPVCVAREEARGNGNSIASHGRPTHPSNVFVRAAAIAYVLDDSLRHTLNGTYPSDTAVHPTSPPEMLRGATRHRRLNVSVSVCKRRLGSKKDVLVPSVCVRDGCLPVCMSVRAV